VAYMFMIWDNPVTAGILPILVQSNAPMTLESSPNVGKQVTLDETESLKVYLK